MKETQQYIVTQDTNSIFGSIDQNTLNANQEFRAAADTYFSSIVEGITQAVSSDIRVQSYAEKTIESSVNNKVEEELKDGSTVCICLDRWLLSSIDQNLQPRIARFGISRRRDGSKAPRQGALPFTEQIAAIKEQIPEIYSKNVILVDDGTFTGGTVSEFLALWKSIEQRPLSIKKIVTFLGNGSQIENLPFQDRIQSVENLYEWLDIRDFGPWGGRQLESSKANAVTSSIPYLFPWSDGEAASLTLTPDFFQLSRTCIEETIEIIQVFEAAAGKNLTFRDLVKTGFSLPTNNEKTIPVSINDQVTVYMQRALEIIESEEDREVIVFDMDGTLYQLDGVNNGFSQSGLEKAVLNNAARFIQTNITDGDLPAAQEILREGLNNKIGISMYLQEQFGIPREVYFDTVWNINPEGIVKNYESAQQTVKALAIEKPESKRILLTSAPRVWANRVLTYLGVSDEFESVYTGDQFTTKKDIFNMLAIRYQPEKITSVGDQEGTDILPAIALGMNGVLINEPNDIRRIIS